MAKESLGVSSDLRGAMVKSKACCAKSKVLSIQNSHAQHYWIAGLNFANQFGVQSEPALALCFDVAVQNRVTHPMIDEILQQVGGADEVGRMRSIAHVVAAHANPKYFNDVFQRKMTFVNGQGTVHGDRYDISCWGIG